MGNVYAILKELQNCEDQSDVFNEKIHEIKYFIAWGMGYVFYGDSKADVLDEYDRIVSDIKFQDDLLQIITDAREEIVNLEDSRFNCLNGDCDYDIW